MTEQITDPYVFVKGSWLDAPDIEAILQVVGQAVAFSGENEIHAKGFFPLLTDLARTRGDDLFWLVDLDGDGERSVAFSGSDSEADYFNKLRRAPEWAADRPFPYAVRYQAFVGAGEWILISDRDGERMYLILFGPVSLEEFRSASIMFRVGEG